LARGCIRHYRQASAWAVIEYIHLNPVEAGFINKPEDWKCSSARDFYESDKYQKGFIELKYSS
jgi:hypothetical protein